MSFGNCLADVVGPGDHERMILLDADREVLRQALPERRHNIHTIEHNLVRIHSPLLARRPRHAVDARVHILQHVDHLADPRAAAEELRHRLVQVEDLAEGFDGADDRRADVEGRAGQGPSRAGTYPQITCLELRQTREPIKERC